MSKFGSRFRDRMDGSYGSDQFGRFLLCFSLILMIIALYWQPRILGIISLALLVFTFYRMFSTKFNQRSKENDAYMNVQDKVTGFFRRIFKKASSSGSSNGPSAVKNKKSFKETVEDHKKYRYFRCPQCNQKLRVPRGKGKVRVICPKCKTEFQRKA